MNESLIRYEDVPEKVWTIPKMTDFWGIGKGLEKRFNKLGIHSIKELAFANPNLIKSKMGLIGLQEFFHANGIDETSVRDKHIKKTAHSLIAKFCLVTIQTKKKLS